MAKAKTADVTEFTSIKITVSASVDLAHSTMDDSDTKDVLITKTTSGGSDYAEVQIDYQEICDLKDWPAIRDAIDACVEKFNARLGLSAAFLNTEEAG